MSTLFTTYHPAFLKKDEWRSAPTYLHDLKKLAAIMAGAKPQRCEVVENASMASFRDYANEWWHDEWAFDLETPGDRLRAIAFGGSPEPGLGADVIAFAFDLQVVPRDDWYPVFAEMFRRARRIVVQNGAFDLPIMVRHGIEVPWERTWDTMLAGYTLNQDDYVGLSHLCSLYLDVEAWKHERDDPTKLLHYNGLDAGYDWLLSERLRERLAK